MKLKSRITNYIESQYGVNAIRGPRGVPHSLSWALNGKTD